MRFSVHHMTAASVKADLVYRVEEYSFDVIPAPATGFTSVLIDSLSLEIDRWGRIVSVWGLCPYTNWTETVLAPPFAQGGDVFIDVDGPLFRGVSTKVESQRGFPKCVDFRSGWVKVVGEPDPVARALIMPGVIIEIGSGGQFCSLWLNPKNGLDIVAKRWEIVDAL